MRASIYARVSTLDQEPENQLAELRRYVAAREWTATEYVDRGISGAKDRRPSLDDLLRDARRRRFDVLIVWRLDRFGRNLRHLITLLEELHALGIAFVSLGEGIDATTPAGKLQMHILGAIAEFERARIAERVRAALQRARSQGKRLGRPWKARPAVMFPGSSVREAARVWASRNPRLHGGFTPAVRSCRLSPCRSTLWRLQLDSPLAPSRDLGEERPMLQRHRKVR
jgi:DNA invertase Pin-like site-specific DNA recombinase